MYPGLGKLIRSWALSHRTINKPHDMSLLSHSPSPDQLPFLCAPLIFATYYVIYGACTATSAPTVAFNLYHLYIQIKKDEQNTPYTSHFAPLPHAHTHTSHSHITPFALLPVNIPLLSGCIQLDSTLFHSFNLIITTTPICILLHYALLHACSCSCLHYTSTLQLFAHTHRDSPLPPYLITPSEPHRAFVVIKPHGSYFTIVAAP